MENLPWHRRILPARNSPFCFPAGLIHRRRLAKERPPSLIRPVTMNLTPLVTPSVRRASMTQIRFLNWAVFLLFPSVVCLAQTDGTSRWGFLTNGVVYSSPLIGSDGAIYVGTEGTVASQSRLYAIKA